MYQRRTNNIIIEGRIGAHENDKSYIEICNVEQSWHLRNTYKSPFVIFGYLCTQLAWNWREPTNPKPFCDSCFEAVYLATLCSGFSLSKRKFWLFWVLTTTSLLENYVQICVQLRIMSTGMSKEHWKNV